MVVKRAPVAIDDKIVKLLDGLTPTLQLTQYGPLPGLHAPPLIALFQLVHIGRPVVDVL